MPTEIYSIITQGILEGTAVLMISHPFDTVKVRLQTIGQIDYGGGEFLYTGPFDCFYKILKREGLFSLYRGLSLPLFCILPTNLVTFFTCDIITKKLLRKSHINDLSKNELFLMSTLSGAIPSVFISPVERVKTRLQIPEGFLDHPNTTYYTIKSIIEQEGYQGIWRGAGLTIARDSIFAGVCIVSYLNLKGIFADPPQVINDKKKYQEYLRLAFCGGVAGMLGWLFSSPLDLIKTRYQAFPPNYYENGIRSVLSYIAAEAKQANVSTLSHFYTGGRLIFLRAFFQYAAMFAAYEFYAEVTQEKSIIEIIKEEKEFREEENKNKKNDQGSDKHSSISDQIDPSDITPDEYNEMFEDKEAASSSPPTPSIKGEKAPEKHFGIKKWKWRRP